MVLEDVDRLFAVMISPKVAIVAYVCLRIFKFLPGKTTCFDMYLFFEGGKHRLRVVEVEPDD